MKFSYVYLKGGLGNQLFQLAFANYLKSLKHRIFIDDSMFNDFKYANNTKRDLIFNIADFGFKSSSNFTKSLFKYFNKIFQSKKIKRILKPKKNKIFNYIKDKDLKDFNNNSLLTIYDGYWQEFEYIKDSKSFLISSLNNYSDISKALIQTKITGSTLVHVRRQDYVSLNEELDEHYYLNAINEARNSILNFHFDVFTDDALWVSSKKLFKDANNIYSPNKKQEDKNEVIKAFSNMLKYENFIIANSSFSYMAALLGSSDNSRVFYPNPWFKNKTKNIYFNRTWSQVNLK